MAEFIYTMQKVRKTAGDKLILDDVTLAFFPGAKIGVVGPNGAGKSTLLKVMAGLEQPNNGEANLAKGASVGILLQEPPLTEGKTVQENVEEAVADIKAKMKRFDEIGMEMAEPDADFDSLMAEMGNLQTELDAHNAWEMDARLEQAMDALQCPPPDTVVDVLSGGERRRVALCKLLLQQPDLLLLDEPSMGLAPLLIKEIFSIIVDINQAGTTILLVEQNANMALSIANRAYVLETGRITLSGDAKELAASEDVRKAYLGG